MMDSGNASGSYPASATSGDASSGVGGEPVAMGSALAAQPERGTVSAPSGAAAPLPSTDSDATGTAEASPAVNTASTVEEAQKRGEPLVVRSYPGR